MYNECDSLTLRQEVMMAWHAINQSSFFSSYGIFYSMISLFSYNEDITSIKRYCPWPSSRFSLIGLIIFTDIHSSSSSCHDQNYFKNCNFTPWFKKLQIRYVN